MFVLPMYIKGVNIVCFQRIEYRVYSIDISIIEALKGKNQKDKYFFSNKYNYDVYHPQYKTDILLNIN